MAGDSTSSDYSYSGEDSAPPPPPTPPGASAQHYVDTLVQASAHAFLPKTVPYAKKGVARGGRKRRGGSQREEVRRAELLLEKRFPYGFEEACGAYEHAEFGVDSCVDGFGVDKDSPRGALGRKRGASLGMPGVVGGDAGGGPDIGRGGPGGGEAGGVVPAKRGREEEPLSPRGDDHSEGDLSGEELRAAVEAVILKKMAADAAAAAAAAGKSGPQNRDEQPKTGPQNPEGASPGPTAGGEQGPPPTVAAPAPEEFFEKNNNTELIPIINAGTDPARVEDGPPVMLIHDQLLAAGDDSSSNDDSWNDDSSNEDSSNEHSFEESNEERRRAEDGVFRQLDLLFRTTKPPDEIPRPVVRNNRPSCVVKKPKTVSTNLKIAEDPAKMGSKPSGETAKLPHRRGHSSIDSPDKDDDDSDDSGHHKHTGKD